jgi:hypothetical protein
MGGGHNAASQTAGALAAPAHLRGTAGPEAMGTAAGLVTSAPAAAAPSAPALEARPVQAALILLQCVLRGRAAQVELMAARSVRAALIAELRAAAQRAQLASVPAGGEGADVDTAVGGAFWRVCHALSDAGAGQPEQALRIFEAVAAQQAQAPQPRPAAPTAENEGTTCVC